MDHEERPPCCFDEWAAANARRARHREEVVGVTAPLLEALEEVGLQGRTVLDVGCGAGELALATLARGAATAHGIDLGSGAIEHARSLARDRGLTDRASFEVADGSTATLPHADVVVLNRVVCCYPDLDALLVNSTRAAGSLWAITAPADRGLPGLWNRVAIWTSNRWYGLRRRKFGSFRVFVHPIERIDRAARQAGFVPIRRERRRVVWELAVYRREPA